MKIFIVEPHGTKAEQTYEQLTTATNTSYELCESAASADVIVVVGGDSAMLRAIHAHSELNTPFFGINRGHVGFLLNRLNFLPDNLVEVIAASLGTEHWTIDAEITWLNGRTTRLNAFNDVYVSPQDGQALKMILSINDTVLDSELIGDGVIVSSPQGSTGYNRVAGGVIISPDSDLIQLTPKVCTIGKNREIATTFVERSDTTFAVEFLDNTNRRASVFFDGLECDYCKSVPTSIKFSKSTKSGVKLLFNKEETYYDKVFNAKYRK